MLTCVQTEQIGGDDQQEADSITPAECDIRDDGRGPDGRGRRSAICDAETAQVERILTSFSG